MFLCKTGMFPTDLQALLITALTPSSGLEAGAGVGPDAAVVSRVTFRLLPGLGPPPVAGEHHDAGREDTEGEGSGENCCKHHCH